MSITVVLGPHAHERLGERPGPAPGYEDTVKFLRHDCDEGVWERDSASGAPRLYIPQLGGSFVLVRRDEGVGWFTKTFVSDTYPKRGRDVEVEWVELEAERS